MYILRLRRQASHPPCFPLQIVRKWSPAFRSFDRESGRPQTAPDVVVRQIPLDQLKRSRPFFPRDGDRGSTQVAARIEARVDRDAPAPARKLVPASPPAFETEQVGDIEDQQATRA